MDGLDRLFYVLFKLHKHSWSTASVRETRNFKYTSHPTLQGTDSKPTTLEMNDFFKNKRKNSVSNAEKLKRAQEKCDRKQLLESDLYKGVDPLLLNALSSALSDDDELNVLGDLSDEPTQEVGTSSVDVNALAEKYSKNYTNYEKTRDISNAKEEKLLDEPKNSSGVADFDTDQEALQVYEKYFDETFPEEYILKGTQEERVNRCVADVVARAVKWVSSDDGKGLEMLKRAHEMMAKGPKTTMDRRQLANLDFKRFSCGYFGAEAQQKLSKLTAQRLKETREKSVDFVKIMNYWEKDFFNLYIMAPEVAAELASQDFQISKEEAYRKLESTNDYGRVLAGQNLARLRAIILDKKGLDMKVGVLDDMFSEGEDSEKSIQETDKTSQESCGQRKTLNKKIFEKEDSPKLKKRKIAQNKPVVDKTGEVGMKPYKINQSSKNKTLDSFLTRLTEKAAKPPNTNLKQDINAMFSDSD